MNKKNAIQFLEYVVHGKIEEAFDRFVQSVGVHHNQYVEAGFDNLKAAMQEDFKVNPEKKFEILSAIAENEKVALLVKITVNEKAYHIAYFFRFEAGKIMEMWDIPQEIQS